MSQEDQEKRGGWSNPASASNGRSGGRPRQLSGQFRRGEVLMFHRVRPGEVAPEEAARVLSVGENELELQIIKTEEIIVIRRPDPEE